jgi:hypothetical protein
LLIDRACACGDRVGVKDRQENGDHARIKVRASQGYEVFAYLFV